MSAALLGHLAPPGWQHFNLTGGHLWSGDTGLGPDAFRALLAGRQASC